MNNQQIILLARSFLGEPDELNSHWTPAEMLMYLNEAIKQTALFTKAMVENFSADSVLDQAEYLTDDLIRQVEQVYFPDVDNADKLTPLISIKQKELDDQYPTWQSDDNGKPRFYTMPNWYTVIIYPKPNVANAGKSFRIRGVVQPVEFNQVDTQVCACRAEFHKAIAYNVCSQAAVKLEDGSDDAFLKKYNNELGIVKAKTDTANKRDLKFTWAH